MITPSVLKPMEAMKAGMFDNRRVEGTSRRASKTRRPSLHSTICRVSSAVKPYLTTCSNSRASSMVTMTAKRAPVSWQADSPISCSTVSTSRLALTRRMAEESAAIRWRNSSISGSPAPRLLLLNWSTFSF